MDQHGDRNYQAKRPSAGHRQIVVNYREWEDLDRVLAQFCTSGSIRPRIVFSRRGKMIGLVPKSLPELTKHGAVDADVERGD